MGAVLAPARFSSVRTSIRDLVADGKSLVRNSVVGGGGQNLILTYDNPNTKGRISKTRAFALPEESRVFVVPREGVFWQRCLLEKGSIQECQLPRDSREYRDSRDSSSEKTPFVMTPYSFAERCSIFSAIENRYRTALFLSFFRAAVVFAVLTRTTANSRPPPPKIY